MIWILVITSCVYVGHWDEEGNRHDPGCQLKTFHFRTKEQCRWQKLLAEWQDHTAFTKTEMFCYQGFKS
jgi:hypothetical protein